MLDGTYLFHCSRVFGPESSQNTCYKLQGRYQQLVISLNSRGEEAITVYQIVRIIIGTRR